MRRSEVVKRNNDRAFRQTSNHIGIVLAKLEPQTEIEEKTDYPIFIPKYQAHFVKIAVRGEVCPLFLHIVADDMLIFENMNRI